MHWKWNVTRILALTSLGRTVFQSWSVTWPIPDSASPSSCSPYLHNSSHYLTIVPGFFGILEDFQGKNIQCKNSYFLFLFLGRFLVYNKISNFHGENILEICRIKLPYIQYPDNQYKLLEIVLITYSVWINS